MKKKPQRQAPRRNARGAKLYRDVNRAKPLIQAGLLTDAPSDGNQYAREDGAWTVVSGGGISDAASDGTYYARRNGAWEDVTNAPVALTGAVNTFTENQIIDKSSGGASLLLQCTSGNTGSIQLRTGTSRRWLITKDNTAEFGSDAGSDFYIQRYNDSGVFQDNPIKITRSTGNIEVASDLSVGGDLDVPSNPPATASSTGKAGTITWDSSYIYICVATDTWERVAINTW